MYVRVTPIDPLSTTHKSAVLSSILYMEVTKKRGPVIENGPERSNGTVHFDRTSSTEKSGPFRKVDWFFRNFSGWTEPIHSVPEILAEWIAPTDCTFYRAQHSLHVNYFRAWHWLPIFPRLTLVTCFTELSTRNFSVPGTDYTFSRAWH